MHVNHRRAQCSGALQEANALWQHAHLGPGLHAPKRHPLSQVSGMLSWPSFYAEAGASLRIYNTTQYFWSNTVFFRPDCNYQLAGAPPDGQKASPMRLRWCMCTCIEPEGR